MFISGLYDLPQMPQPPSSLAHISLQYGVNSSLGCEADAFNRLLALNLADIVYDDTDRILYSVVPISLKPGILKLWLSGQIWPSCLCK